ncbi:SAM-dependent methyltransferase [Nocardiopsis sp. NPDC006938]|uniref:SAM-dependent methyltransferase n=1 Tax=Nocardiopsis sp. NPDC006938 TaxID=3364337 RepID=UPI00367A2191
MTNSAVWPVHIPQVSSARVYNYLSKGKDHFRADRSLAEQMVAANTTHIDLAQESTTFVDQAVEELVGDGVEQLVVLGCGLPHPSARPVHLTAQAISPSASVLYLDRDLSCVVTTRAHHHAARGVTVLDGDLTDPLHLVADPAVQAALDPDRPVGVVCDLTLHHLVDADVETLALTLATALPAGSRLALTHPSGDEAALAADVYLAAIRDGRAAEDTYLARTAEGLDPLLKGWTLSTCEVSEHGLLTATAQLP